MLKRQGKKRNWGAALFASSLAAWVSYFGFAWLAQTLLSMLPLAPQSTHPAPRSDLSVAIAIFGAPVVLIVCFVLSGVALVFSEYFRLTKWWQMACIGMTVGLMFALGLASPRAAESHVWSGRSWIVGVVHFMLTGACAGTAAWASLWLDSKSTRGRETEAVH